VKQGSHRFDWVSTKVSKTAAKIMQEKERDKEKKGEKRNVRQPPLGASSDIAQRKEDSADGPGGAQAGGVDGVLQARDEQGAEEGGEVLREVCVGALGCRVANSGC
jgi:hypothetical protein